MCDYSLFNVKNRLAREADELILRRFESGSLGFCDLGEIEAASKRNVLSRTWSDFVGWMFPRRACGLTAICIPPGAQLMISEVPSYAKPWLGSLVNERVQFTQLSERTYTHRDALLLPGGEPVLLQRLPVGLRISVMSLAPLEVEAFEPEAAFDFVERLAPIFITRLEGR